ncbi:HNH endonuclease [Pontiellaceae bacterium B1224]|nr:HNH endonuclease [Pontiellaceae bacterium B1224]
MNSNISKSRYGELWTRQESILAFELYCRIPFHKTKANNPVVIELATVLGRTPASVARKLGNFGACDPSLRKMDVSGLAHTSKLDRSIWEEFHSDWNGLVWEANKLRIKAEEKLTRPTGASEKLGLTKQRVHQRFFREAILSSYDSACCVTGITTSECLIASHIIPWGKDVRFRTDPQNGLCLSATFDRLFDSGLMCITADLRLFFSQQITTSKNPAICDLLCRYQNQPIRKPRRFLPNPEFLDWHRKNLFKL